MSRDLQDSDVSQDGHLPREPASTLERMLERGEGQHVEFKLRLPRERRLARLLGALANSGGGVVLVGVDDKGVVHGVGDPASVVDVIMSVARLHLDPVPELKATVARQGDRDVLAREERKARMRAS